MEEKNFLEDINHAIPKGIDWKAGAINYIKNAKLEESELFEEYHFKKPFTTALDSYLTEMYLFLNVLKKLNLATGSNILDVGCGPGWVSNYLANIGYNVTGIDICKDMIDIAKKRSDVLPMTTFLEHDIEESKLPTNELYDAAFFFSAVHHFYNPVNAILNVSKNLKPDGYIVIVEDSLPPNSVLQDENAIEIMKKYHTLERPFTLDQMNKLLDLSGYEHREFYRSINGLFNSSEKSVEEVNTKIMNDSFYQVVIASRDEQTIDRISQKGDVEYTGFYDQEEDFRWSKEKSFIKFNKSYRSLEISSYYYHLTQKEQAIYVSINDREIEKIQINNNKHVIKLKGVSRIDFYSDSVFCPLWFDQPDRRMLSFKISLK